MTSIFTSNNGDALREQSDARHPRRARRRGPARRRARSGALLRRRWRRGEYSGHCAGVAQRDGHHRWWTGVGRFRLPSDDRPRLVQRAGPDTNEDGHRDGARGAGTGTGSRALLSHACAWCIPALRSLHECVRLQEHSLSRIQRAGWVQILRSLCAARHRRHSPSHLVPQPRQKRWTQIWKYVDEDRCEPCHIVQVEEKTKKTLKKIS